MSPIIPILFAIGAYTAFQFLVAKSAMKIDGILGSALIGFASGTIALLVWLVTRARGSSMLPTTQPGVAWSIAAGLMVGLFQIALVTAFARGGVAYAVPLIYGATIAFAALLSWAFFNEHVSAMQCAGIACIAIGVGIVAYARFVTQK